MNADWLSLPSMRAHYLGTVQQLELLQAVESKPSKAQEKLAAECWSMRRDAYRILAKAVGEQPGAAVERESLPFGWSLEQLTSGILREWLLHDDPMLYIITSRCTMPFYGGVPFFMTKMEACGRYSHQFWRAAEGGCLRNVRHREGREHS